MNIDRTIMALFCLFGSAFAAEPAAPTPRPPIFQPTATGIHRITFKARIDAFAELVIQDGRMFLNSKGSKPAENITINSRKWKAVFTRTFPTISSSARLSCPSLESPYPPSLSNREAP
jgi:hypothetical protein